MFQHDANILKNGNIAVFNNDDVAKEGIVSSVVVFSQKTPKTESKVEFKFNLNFDSLTTGKSTKTGNVTELNNGNLLICEGVINRIIEINKNTEVVWDAFTYQYNSKNKNWQPAFQYRTSFSSSLYPYFFSLNKIALRNRELRFLLVNEGSEKDVLEILAIGNNQTRFIKHEVLLTSSSNKITLEVNNKEKEIIIRSKISGQTKHIDLTRLN